MAHIEFLTKIGLSETEATLYNTLVESGPQSVTALSERAQIKRTLVYHAAQKLKDLGLINEFEKAKKIHYRATNPQHIEDLVRAKLNEADRLSREFSTLLPYLSKQYSQSDVRPLIDISTGIAGMKKTYRLILREADELLIFASSSARLNPDVDAIIRKQIEKQEEKGIKVRSIVKDYTLSGTEGDRLLEGTKSVSIRTLPHDEFLSQTQIFIWKDTVAVSTVGGELITTIIRNKEIAETMRIIFNSLWKRANAPK